MVVVFVFYLNLFIYFLFIFKICVIILIHTSIKLLYLDILLDCNTNNINDDGKAVNKLICLKLLKYVDRYYSSTVSK